MAGRRSSVELSSRANDEWIDILRVQEVFYFSNEHFIDGRETVLRWMVGDPRALRWGPWLAKGHTAWLALWVGATFGTLLPLTGVVPYVGCVWTWFLAQPLFVVWGLGSNRWLTQYLFASFQVWFLIGLTAFVLGMEVDIFRGDVRVMGAFGLWESMVFGLILDASNTVSVWHKRIFVGTMVVVLPSFMLIAHLGAMELVEPRQLDLTLASSLPMGSNTLQLTTQRLVTIWLFYVKNLYRLLRYPSAFMMIQARVVQERLQVGLLRARIRKRGDDTQVLHLKRVTQPTTSFAPRHAPTRLHPVRALDHGAF